MIFVSVGAARYGSIASYDDHPPRAITIRGETFSSTRRWFVQSEVEYLDALADLIFKYPTHDDSRHIGNDPR